MLTVYPVQQVPHHCPPLSRSRNFLNNLLISFAAKLQPTASLTVLSLFRHPLYPTLHSLAQSGLSSATLCTRPSFLWHSLVSAPPPSVPDPPFSDTVWSQLRHPLYPTFLSLAQSGLSSVLRAEEAHNNNSNNNNNNNNNILYSSQREIKAVVRSHNKEHISIILSHETHVHTHLDIHIPRCWNTSL